jgi:hypothetical protein
MGRMYTASFSAVAITAIQDMFEIVAPATGIVIIHRARITQTSDVGDAAEEMLLVQHTVGYTTSGSGGSSPTVDKHDNGDAAFAGTVEANNTTQALNGTGRSIVEEAFNIRNGYDYCPTPEERIILGPSARYVLELPAAPADSLTMSGSITFEEIGGAV